MPEPPRTGDAVLELVRKSDLVETGALDGFVSNSGTLPPSATDTATNLIRAGLITAFQAKLILQGKYKGFRLGPYKILDQIGVGGMGQVFLAEHVAMRRRVAMKVLPGRLAANAAGVERFYREARAVAALDHPNIVRAHDVACEKGTHFLVMEYVEGKNLDQRLKEAGGRVPWGEAVGYAVQAAAGLHHAHEKGLVHRDVKPANLLVGRDGVVKILDMGLARFFQDDSDRLTKQLDPGGVMGTADYVAPEQLIDTAITDHRADIYSLGATVYHLITGKPPFAGSTTAKLVAHQLKTAPLAHSVQAGVPAELSAVVQKMMAKDPAERYQTAAEAIRDLLPFVGDPRRDGTAATALPPLAAAAVRQSTANLKGSLKRKRGRKPNRKKLLTVVGIGIVALGGLLGLAFALAGSKGNKTAKGDPPAGNPAAPQSVFPLAYKLAGDPRASVEATLFTPDGKWLVTAGTDKTIRVWDAASGKPVHRMDGHAGNVRGLALLPDGKRVLSSSADKTVRLWDFTTGRWLRTYDAANTYVTNIALLPDGKRFLASGSDGSVWLWDTESGDILKRYNTEPVAVYALAVTSDGKRAVAGTWDTRRNSLRPGDDGSWLPPIHVWVFDIDTGAELRRITAPASVSHVMLSPDSKLAAFGTDTGVALWNLDTGELRRFTGLSRRVTCATFTRDGKHLVSTGYDNGLHVWEVATGKMVASEAILPGQGFYVQPAPDGKRVAAGGVNGGGGVWLLPPGVATP